MKLIRLLLTGGIALAALSLSSSAGTADHEPHLENLAKPHQVLKHFDTNENGEIDGTEREILRKAFALNPALKPLDLNGDGKLDDKEISAIHPKVHASDDSLKVTRKGKLSKRKLPI